jgi:hypothetical protein
MTTASTPTDVGRPTDEARVLIERTDGTNDASRQVIMAAERVNSFYRRRAAPKASEAISVDLSGAQATHGEQ